MMNPTEILALFPSTAVRAIIYTCTGSTSLDHDNYGDHDDDHVDDHDEDHSDHADDHDDGHHSIPLPGL